MLSVPPGVGIFLFVPPADLRKSYDGLAGLAQEHLKKNVLDGGLFVFFNRRRDRVKLLWWDEDGFALFAKRNESDDPHSDRFTGFDGDADNLADRLAAAGGMDGTPPSRGPRRSPMSRDAALIVPPRAPTTSSQRNSTNSGVC